MRAVVTIGIGFGCLGLVLAAAGEARAQGGWTDDGTVVRLTTKTDAVGIGTTTPGDKLHVIGNARIEGRVVSEVIAAPAQTLLHLRVGGRDALRLDPTGGSPNIIGGAHVNVVNPALVGGTIAGGGDPNVGFPLPNVITDNFGSIGGGRGNQAGDSSTVSGGAENTASGTSSTISGGEENTASGTSSTISGGQDNVASGIAATVAGGMGNVAQGNFSFAAGRQAKANHEGSFVWADSTTADFVSQGPNQFLIRAAGGARLVKGTSTFSLTNATFQVESTATAGEGALIRNFSSTNTNAVIKLIKAGTGDFLTCRDNIGFGEAPVCHINGAGTFVAGSDFAEALPARGGRTGYEPGDVLVMSGDDAGTVEKATRVHDARVVGVYSTRPAMLGADKAGATRIDPDDIPVAIVGIVPTKVSAENGAIKPGDLLTTATVPGHAMKASPVMVSGVALYPTGTILGKALGSLESGTGLIRVLVTLK